jgi:hypothetical protein
MYGILARLVLFAGLSTIICLGFSSSSEYNMVYRVAGMIVALVGAVQLLYSNKRYSKKPLSLRQLHKKRLMKKKRN